MKLFVGAISIGLLLATPVLAQDSSDNQGPAPASNAGQQLDNATNGSQTTGQTFDGGYTPTDATPTKDTSAPPEPPSSPADGTPQ